MAKAIANPYEDMFVKIDEHIKKHETPVRRAAQFAAANIQTTLCGYYVKVKPILDLLGLMIGKVAGAAITALSVALQTFCSMPAAYDGMKKGAAKKFELARSKATSAICKAYDKVKAFIALGLQLFKRPGWAQAILGLVAGIDSLCASGF